MFPGWVSAIDVADTGERSDLSHRLWEPDTRGEGPVDLVDFPTTSESLFDEIKGHANVMNAMISISQRHAVPRASLREADGGAMIAGVVGSAVSPAVSRSWYVADMVDVSGGSKGGGAAARAGVLASAAEILDFSGSGDEAANNFRITI